MDLAGLRRAAATWLAERIARADPEVATTPLARTLDRPVMVVAFEGWNDAGEAASSAVVHLARTWGAEALAEIDGEEFFDFTEVRPEVSLDDSGERQILWPATTLALAPGAPGERDVILVSGPEPHLRWRAYCEAFADLATSLGVTEVLTLGAHLAEITHSRVVPLSGTSSAPGALASGVSPSHYEGPTGIVGVLNVALAEAGIAATSLWASVPCYSLPVSPRAALELVAGATRVIGRYADTSELEIAGAEYDRHMDELVRDDENVAAYVARIAELEELAQEESVLDERSTAHVFEEIEQYLRNNRPR